ncbi:MAG: hypothetical protein HFH60_07190 [Lachnospiraceae bacterium]|nr:hypothetical protein [Lachnospiraceae bacterium]MCI9546451.1 hypothetical protein [Lachnospiraceae bacterium]
MKNKKLGYAWISLLLTGALCLPGGAVVQANENVEEPNVEFSEEVVSANDQEFLVEGDGGDEWDAISVNDLPDKNKEMILENNEDSISQDKEAVGQNDEVVSQNEETVLENNENKMEDRAENGMPSPGGGLSDNASQQKYRMAEENKLAEVDQESLKVVLPVEIPFSMVLFGKEGQAMEGIVKSEQYCIENKGYEDVKISFQGVCIGANQNDYALGHDFMKEGLTPAKKNAWICLKWEDKERKEMDLPEIVMGDETTPGEGQIVLKAPRRDANGNVIGENNDSRAYFSFDGDLKSDMGEAWREDELTIKLDYSIEDIKSSTVNEKIKDNAEGLDTAEAFVARKKLENDSDNVSGNERDEEGILDKGKDYNFSQVSENDVVSENDISVSRNDVVSENDISISENEE